MENLYNQSPSFQTVQVIFSENKTFFMPFSLVTEDGHLIKL